MKLKNLISMLQPKNKALRKPSASKIKNNYACSDAALEREIKAFLNHEIDARDCLQTFIEHMAYDEDRRIKENEIIFDMLEDFLQDAKWKKEWTIDCGDYNPARPEPWLRIVYETYSNKLFYLRNAESNLENEGKEVSAKNVAESTSHWGIPVTEAEYLHKEELEAKEAQLREKICSGNFTPLEALLIVKENWDLLYTYQATYEALEYCIAASKDHATPEYFYSAFRDFGYKMGELYRKAKEK